MQTIFTVVDHEFFLVVVLLTNPTTALHTVPHPSDPNHTVGTRENGDDPPTHHHYSEQTLQIVQFTQLPIRTEYLVDLYNNNSHHEQ